MPTEARLKKFKNPCTRGWFQRSDPSSVEFFLAEGDLVGRSCRNFLSDNTFCFQLSTVFQLDIQLSQAASCQLLDKLHPALP